jgi:MFS family permease
MKFDRSIRNVALLSGCMAFAQTQMVLIFSASSLIGAAIAPPGVLVTFGFPFRFALTGDMLATLPITCQFIAMTLATVPAAQLMKRIGRARGFNSFIALGSLGAALALYALFERDFWLFCLGSALFGTSAGSNQQFRFAAVDTALPDFKSRAVSLVLAGGVFAGFAGPTLSTWANDMLAPVIFGGVFVVIIALQLLMMAMLAFTDIPPASEVELRGEVRPFREISRQPKFIVALLSAMLGYGVMNLVMLSTPLFMKYHPTHPFAIPQVNHVIMWHVVGMFAPSFVTGWLIRRYGDLNIIAAGAVVGVLCLVVNLSGDSIWHIGIAMALVGVAWNFMFTGGTTMLLETYTPAEKATIQGINDLFVFGTVAVCSLAAGALYQLVGWAALNVAVIPVLGVAIFANIWIRTLRQPAPAE